MEGKFQTPLIDADVLFYCYQADWTHPFEFKRIIERTILLKETQELG